MVNARRAARELALKALFQLDVGKQPLNEVMAGALDQLVQTVDHPVSQHLHELQAEVKRTIEERRAELSTQSLRQVRSVAKVVRTAVAQLLETLSSRAHIVVERPESNDPAQSSSDVEVAVEEAISMARRVLQRETLQREMVESLVECGIQRAQLAGATYTNALPPALETARYLHSLVGGVLEHREDIDKTVAGLSEGWALDRQPAVDRNILRMAAYEIMFRPDIPPGASINEAVELAKKYSTAESGKFVNGVLGALASSIGRGDAGNGRGITTTEQVEGT